MEYKETVQKKIEDLHNIIVDELENKLPNLEEILEDSHVYTLLFSLKKFYKSEYLEIL